MPPPDGITLRAAAANDIEALVRLDTAAFGARREEVIRQLLTEGSGIVATRDERPIGFAMARQAGRGTLIGPVVADTEELAIALVSAVLNASTGFTRIDIPAEAEQLARWLDTAGLVRVDRVTAMLRGDRVEPQGVRTFGLVTQALG